MFLGIVEITERGRNIYSWMKLFTLFSVCPLAMYRYLDVYTSGSPAETMFKVRLAMPSSNLRIWTVFLTRCTSCTNRCIDFSPSFFERDMADPKTRKKTIATKTRQKNKQLGRQWIPLNVRFKYGLQLSDRNSQNERRIAEMPIFSVLLVLYMESFDGTSNVCLLYTSPSPRD